MAGLTDCQSAVAWPRLFCRVILKLVGCSVGSETISLSDTAAVAPAILARQISETAGATPALAPRAPPATSPPSLAALDRVLGGFSLLLLWLCWSYLPPSGGSGPARPAQPGAGQTPAAHRGTGPAASPAARQSSAAGPASPSSPMIRPPPVPTLPYRTRVEQCSPTLQCSAGLGSRPLPGQATDPP